MVVANPNEPAPCRGVWYFEPEGDWRDDSVFFVEQIVGKRRGASGQLEYFVKWWNYAEDENTWEPEKVRLLGYSWVNDRLVKTPVTF